MRNPAAEGLEKLVAERGDQLMRAALALAGGSRPEGEDLLQEALERLLRNWRRVDDPEGYLRRTLYNLAADGWRRRGRWHSRMPLVRAAYRETAADATAAVDLRDELVQALGQLAPQQRTVVVLRYWEQRTESETAALLGISEGAVKSAASRGLQRLRDLVVAWPGPGHGTARGVSERAGAETDVELTEGRR